MNDRPALQVRLKNADKGLAFMVQLKLLEKKKREADPADVLLRQLCEPDPGRGKDSRHRHASKRPGRRGAFSSKDGMSIPYPHRLRLSQRDKPGPSKRFANAVSLRNTCPAANGESETKGSNRNEADRRWLGH